MAVAFRAESHVIGTSTSPTGTEPAGTVQGDVLVAFFEAAGTTAFTPPNGWTTLYSGVSATTQFSYYLGYIVRGASSPGLTWTYSGNTYRELYIVGFSGCDTNNPIDASNQTASGSGLAVNPDPPSVTAVSSAAMALAIGANWNGSGSGGWTAPSGYTIRTNNANGNDLVIASKLLSASGPEDPGAFGNVSNSGTTDYWSATVTLSPPIPAITPSVAWFVA